MKGILQYAQDVIDEGSEEWPPKQVDRDEAMQGTLKDLSNLGISEAELAEFLNQNHDTFVMSVIACGGLPFGDGIIVNQKIFMAFVAQSIFVGIEAERKRVADRRAT